MESIIRKVEEINTDERRVYESLLGHALRENQQVILHVVELDVEPDEAGRKTALGRAAEIARQGRAAATQDGVTPEEVDQAIDEAIQHVRRTQR